MAKYIWVVFIWNNLACGGKVYFQSADQSVSVPQSSQREWNSNAPNIRMTSPASAFNVSTQLWFIQKRVCWTCASHPSLWKPPFGGEKQNCDSRMVRQAVSPGLRGAAFDVFVGVQSFYFYSVWAHFPQDTLSRCVKRYTGLWVSGGIPLSKCQPLGALIDILHQCRSTDWDFTLDSSRRCNPKPAQWVAHYTDIILTRLLNSVELKSGALYRVVFPLVPS